MRALTTKEIGQVSGAEMEEITVTAQRTDGSSLDGHAMMMMQGDYMDSLVLMDSADGSYGGEGGLGGAAELALDEGLQEILDQLESIGDMTEEEQKQLAENIDAIRDAALAAAEQLGESMGEAEFAKLMKGLGVLGDVADGISIGLALGQEGATLDNVAAAIAFVAGIGISIGVAAVGAGPLTGLAVVSLSTFAIQEGVIAVAETAIEISSQLSDAAAQTDTPGFWENLFGLTPH